MCKPSTPKLPPLPPRRQSAKSAKYPAIAMALGDGVRDTTTQPMAATPRAVRSPISGVTNRKGTSAYLASDMNTILG